MTECPRCGLKYLCGCNPPNFTHKRANTPDPLPTLRAGRVNPQDAHLVWDNRAIRRDSELILRRAKQMGQSEGYPVGVFRRGSGFYFIEPAALEAHLEKGADNYIGAVGADSTVSDVEFMLSA